MEFNKIGNALNAKCMADQSQAGKFLAVVRAGIVACMNALVKVDATPCVGRINPYVFQTMEGASAGAKSGVIKGGEEDVVLSVPGIGGR